jgi:catechol 2,3-dioxygenase-like lactoylglutathione lyase family enzyme
MRCRDMAASLAFYTGVLDFQVKYPATTSAEPVVTIVAGDAELQLSILDGVLGNPVNVWVEGVDRLFTKYLERGLDTSSKRDSPVHQGPLDQTWGTREFYVNDPDGNTLRFCQPLR